MKPNRGRLQGMEWGVFGEQLRLLTERRPSDLFRAMVVIVVIIVGGLIVIVVGVIVVGMVVVGGLIVSMVVVGVIGMTRYGAEKHQGDAKNRRSSE